MGILLRCRAGTRYMYKSLAASYMYMQQGMLRRVQGQALIKQHITNDELVYHVYTLLKMGCYPSTPCLQFD